MALILALLAASLVALAVGKSPWLCFASLWQGALGTPGNLAGTLIKATPLFLTGLAVAIAFKGGLFNIGGEGQLYMGAISAAYLGTLFPHLPSWLYLPLILLLSLSAGAVVWGLIAGWLKSSRGVHEVVSTIMLNYIAIYLTDYLANGPLSSGPYSTKTKAVVESARLGVIWDLVIVHLSWGLPLALLSCLLVYVFFKHSLAGYELRAFGASPAAAECGGIKKSSQILLSMGLSGACAGLAGALIVLGQQHTFYAQFSPGYGYDGIAVALLAGNQPLGIIPAALFFGGLRSADRWMQLKVGMPKELVFIIQGTVILFVGLDKVLPRLSIFYRRGHRGKIIPNAPSPQPSPQRGEGIRRDTK